MEGKQVPCTVCESVVAVFILVVAMHAIADKRESHVEEEKR
jgi:hypothetical protein